MRLSRLHVNNVRNLQEIALNLDPSCNLFLGNNGSGKTSVLEAVYLLAVGRSFRSRQIQSVIHYEQDKLACFGEIIDANERKIPLGIEKNRQGEVVCKVRGENCARLSEFAAHLPVQLITPDTFRLLSAGPQERRRFIDWGVFHVEPRFAQLSQRYQRLLKQRNATLKISRRLTAFDQELAEVGAVIHQMRDAYFSELTPFLQQMQAVLVPELEIRVQYEAGWNTKVSFAQALTDALPQDQRAGYTHVGPHVAELKITAGKHSAQQVLSRGQLKLFICAIYMAQAQHLQATLGKKCLYLLDDLASELDDNNRQRVLRTLLEQHHQIFITGVALEDDAVMAEFSHQRFHVEHGVVKPAASLASL